MTTFNTKNQAKRKYYYIAGILVVLLIIVSLAFNSFRKSDCDPNGSESITPSGVSQGAKQEIKSDPIEYISVDTNSGQIRGKKSTFNNITVNTFLGIPYANPPIGVLRFDKTSPIEKWDGVRDALQHPASCLQVILIRQLI